MASKNTLQASADEQDFDDAIFGDADELFPENKASDNNKINARRKIEHYLELKRLKEEFGDIEDDDF